MGNCMVLEHKQIVEGKSGKVAMSRNAALEVNKVDEVLSATEDVEVLRQKSSHESVSMFTYTELTLATKNFLPHQILGQGGFGTVYKGLIQESIKPGFHFTHVAVKVLNREGKQGDREWLAEVNYLGQFSHPNLVKLIGYCCEGEHRLLVYEYMARGSLERHLFQRLSLSMTWATRMKIALDAAKGLAFLHGFERPVIYRDFKTSNILLDADYNAKLSDFGLAKEGPIGDQTHVSTRVMGTYGYAAPEYVMTGHLTARSDVYGFGVVLLEMLVGRRATDKRRPGRGRSLVEWARPLLIRSRKLPKILDPRLEGQHSVGAAQKVANLAYRCLSQNPKWRPTMNQVVEILQSIQHLSEEEILFQSSGSAVTLYEAAESLEREREDTASGRRRRRDGRSKSEPPKEVCFT